VRLKSIPPIVKAIGGREAILEQSKVYCTCVCTWTCDRLGAERKRERREREGKGGRRKRGERGRERERGGE
jgi:hypothetical protein